MRAGSAVVHHMPCYMTETNVRMPKWKNKLHWHTAAAPAVAKRYII